MLACLAPEQDDVKELTIEEEHWRFSCIAPSLMAVRHSNLMQCGLTEIRKIGRFKVKNCQGVKA